MIPYMAAVLSVILDILFPPVCVACGHDRGEAERDSILCSQCRAALVPDPALHCPVCRKQLPLDAIDSPRSARCHPSASHLVLSAVPYEHPVAKALIKQLKFQRSEQAASILTDLCVSAFKNLPMHKLGAIVPIPLSSKRLRLRGFNQAELLASALGRAYTLPMEKVLLRVRDTSPQSDLTHFTERRVNVADAFILDARVGTHAAQYAIVDDVWTSGATMSEAAAVLRQAGARTLYGIVVARAGLH